MSLVACSLDGFKLFVLNFDDFCAFSSHFNSPFHILHKLRQCLVMYVHTYTHTHTHTDAGNSLALVSHSTAAWC
eukprot:m.140747 g.140747  ORF g.140747 m.140747 type:complete len:74 (-) comp14034_c0_seq18:4841-5062(-)